MIDPETLARTLTHAEQVILETARLVAAERGESWYWRSWAEDVAYIGERLRVLRDEAAAHE